MEHDIRSAWLAFRRGKRPSPEIDRFAYALEYNIRILQHSIDQKTYRHGGYNARSIMEKKERRLAVASVPDRIVHRLVYDELLGIFDKTFDSDVWSCRAGKGLHRCLQRTQSLLKKYPGGYVWRMDVKKFFDSVDHDVLLRCIKRRVRNPRILWLCQEIIGSYACKQVGDKRIGIPIGNLTSQIFANIYLHEFDRYVRNTLRPHAYVWYGDDVALWWPSRQSAYTARKQAAIFLKQELGLEINVHNDFVVAAARGLHYLGHAVMPTYIVVDQHTTKASLARSTLRSVASYKSLLLAKIPKKELDWNLMHEIDTITSS